jgi:hypothetical protein
MSDRKATSFSPIGQAKPLLQKRSPLYQRDVMKRFNVFTLQQECCLVNTLLLRPRKLWVKCQFFA